jgi:hypothetical protein
MCPELGNVAAGIEERLAVGLELLFFTCAIFPQRTVLAYLPPLSSSIISETTKISSDLRTFSTGMETRRAISSG